MRISSKAGGAGASQSVTATKSVSMTDGPLSVSQSSVVINVGDALRVSGTAQFIAVARARIASLPDIRTAKVEAIKVKLESNEYHPDGEAVADGLVREHMPARRNP